MKILQLDCPECGKITEVDRDELIKQLDPKYPGQRLTYECSCGVCQFILEPRIIKHGNSKTSS